jgi:hypothetical protein
LDLVPVEAIVCALSIIRSELSLVPALIFVRLPAVPSGQIGVGKRERSSPDGSTLAPLPGQVLTVMESPSCRNWLGQNARRAKWLLRNRKKLRLDLDGRIR